MFLPFCVLVVLCQSYINPENDTSLSFAQNVVKDKLSLLCCKMQDVLSDSSQQVL